MWSNPYTIRVHLCSIRHSNPCLETCWRLVWGVKILNVYSAYGLVLCPNELKIQISHLEWNNCAAMQLTVRCRTILPAAPYFTTTFMPLVEQQPALTKSLLSAMFVQPCHSLADPPLAVWMDGEGQYTDPACPLTVHAENNRGPCVLQVASQQR